MGFLHPLYSDSPRPERFTYPFCYEPHPLCEMAAKEVQAYISSHEEIREDADKGKMFGVLVVEHQGSLFPSQEKNMTVLPNSKVCSIS